MVAGVALRCAAEGPAADDDTGAGGTTGGGGGSAGSAGKSAGGTSAAGSAGVGGGAGNAGTTAAGSSSGGSGGLGQSGASGAPAAGTAGTAGGASGGSGGSGMTGCTITATSSVSSKIATVGIVEWSANLTALESASIEFGLDTNYGMTAPVDLGEPNYRTLLLGMKSDKTYHFRVVAMSGGQRCTSPDYTLMTGFLPNGLAKPTVSTPGAPDKLYGGYMITARWGMNNQGPAMILDKDGDIVWYFPVEDDVIRARLSYDGKRMWIRNTAQTDGQGWVRRVTLDGLTEEKWDLPHTTHDLAVLPDGNVGLIEHTEGNGCWGVAEFNPTTEELKSLFNLEEAHGQQRCQVNYLAYHAGDNSFVVSDYAQSTVVKINRAGDLVWVLNGTPSDFTGTSWSGQHGVHILAPEHLLVFSNGAMGAGSRSIVYELMLNTTSMAAEEIWSYDADITTPFGGDVQRLANGNTIITYSSSGVIQELDPVGNLLQEFEYSVGSTFSYMEKRLSLYDSPPPKIHGL
ncbi:MAG TPA: aryl-sulfate sulfotransferase [Polyangiaceae bacterium]